MKHILLITAYTQLDYLLEQLSMYDTDKDFCAYIHWDKKSSTADLLKEIAAHPSVKRVCSQYSINWGSRNLLVAMLLLCRYALEDLEKEENPECFIHSISGTDILIHSLSETKDFFDRHKAEGFMEFFPLPASHWYEGGLDRLTWRHPLDKLDIRDACQYAVYQRYLQMQKSKGFQRPLPPVKLYGGSCWWSLPLEMAAYWVQHYNDGGLYDRMEDAFCPEEILPQTILQNSPFKSCIQNNPLRYMCWDYGTRGTPALLENYDLSYMLQSENMWGRKVADKVSDEIRKFFQWVVNLPQLKLSAHSGKSALRQTADFLLQYADYCPLLGLMDGMMGAIVFLACYGRICQQEDCAEAALSKLENAANRHKEILTSDFNNGTFGFVYALAWLCLHGFVKATPLYEQILNAFDGKIIQASNNEEWQARFRDPFWSGYYQQDLYIRLRKVPCGSFSSSSNGNISATLIQKAAQSPFKTSIGMAGIAGAGFSLLRTLYGSQIPPFIIQE